MARKKGAKGLNQQKQLKDEIEAEMNNISYQRQHRDTRFVKRSFIESLFSENSPPKLRNSLRADIAASKDDDALSHIDVTNLEKFVSGRAAKLYCVLLLLDRSQLIVALSHANPPITDDIFDKMHGDFGPYCSLEFLQNCPDLHHIAEDVFKHQWCIPPIFRPEAHGKYEAAWDLRFPFLTEPKRIGGGSFGEVFKVQVADEHLDAEGYIPGQVIAYKAVKKGHETRWDRMLSERETVRSRRHDGIIQLFASFSAGAEDPPVEDDTTEYLHLFFPHTDAGDMKSWLDLRKPPDGLSEDKIRQKFIYRSIQNLASAVAFIHREIKTQIAYHHDLKPSNILLFERNPQESTWKICDFGHAALKDSEGTSGTAHTDENRFGSYVYRPPEYFVGPSKHGRTFDIYSLACIFLNLMTVAKHGWTDDGYREFERRRGANEDHPLKVPKTVMTDYSFHNNPAVVASWIEGLKKGENDQRFYGLLEIIEEMLQEKDQRIFSWEVDVDIFVLLNPCVGEKGFRERLEHVVQASKTSLSLIDNKHNPLQRAVRKKQYWKISILKRMMWSNWKPEAMVKTRPGSKMAERCYSTLGDFAYTQDYVQNPLYGRHNVDKKIAAGFARSKIIGLHGISGIGKSHLAHHYASHFRNTKVAEHRIHTFWVEAGNRHKLLESLRKIAEKVHGAVFEPDSAIDIVRTWLLNKDNGPWLIVLDGLNSEEFASSIKAFMPVLEPSHAGQILITTTNRGLLKHFVKLKPSEGQCIEVDNLREQESLDLFRWYNEDVLTDEEMSKFLSKVALPVFIKMLANHMLEFKIPMSDMYQHLTTKRAEFPDLVNQLFDENHDIFRPLVTARCDEKRPIRGLTNPTLKLLGELSCLNNARIESELIETQFEEKDRDKLAVMLGRLENCSFIGKDNDRNYFMHEFVQREVRRRIKKQWDVATLIRLHGSALCMLYVRYRDDKAQWKELDDNHQRTYHLKLRFIPHFERFLDFVKEHPKSKSFAGFELQDRMVASVITFAQVFMEEGRYEDASCVLEFTHRLYRQRTYRYELIRLLVQAHTLPPLARARKSEWLKSETLLKDSIQECEQEHMSKERWLCALALSDLYARARHPAKALNQLKSLQDCSLTIKRGVPEIIKRGNPKLDEDTARILAVNRRIGEAKAFLLHARLLKADHAGGKRTDYLKKAENAFEEAKTAVSDWFRDQAEWIQIEEGLGSVFCECGTQEDLRKADDIFRKLNSRLEKEFNAPERSLSQKKLWDVRCRTAAVWLKTGFTVSADAAVKRLEEALQHYEKCYGPKNDHTRTCAYHLRDVISRTDSQRAKELQKIYELNMVNFEDPFLDDGNENGKLSLWTIVEYVLFGSMLLYLCNSCGLVSDLGFLDVRKRMAGRGVV
ncbi:uncharacterized protein BDR25DRAFT_345891 [Lindgomyces ingoldianus]|uniref:Uncharacterized protein n=1 Tax=Lindgomyces ingoldianus TaxID=673940 RepID=A0ACB6QGH8_9PLEO|nr:uncharacterized protein BDR25DRAFT_345891 [Lindgomyces ingoldianus]KAF2465668.1 hypothetical protein BDR25DRAFT_345891 [Lindgomyces ingoldianus]